MTYKKKKKKKKMSCVDCGKRRKQTFMKREVYKGVLAKGGRNG